MKHLVLLSLLALSFNTWSFDHKHTSYNALLKKVVKFEGKQSLVNYQMMKKEPKVLNDYLKSLSDVSQKEYQGWTKDQQLSFLINAYNAFTFKIIVDNYPVKSIKKLGGFFSSAWKKKFFNLFGQETHLDNIEHDMIRANFKEARIHFAVVCASIGCPPIQDTAFTAENLNTLLEKGSQIFLSDPTKNRYDEKKKVLYLSRIFDWYGKDFNEKYGDHKKFISKYIKFPKEAKQEWTDYSWNLNEWK